MLNAADKSRTHGFTLIELMIGIVIMAIVLALGMPSYATWIQNTRLRNAAESISNGLQLARSEAVKRNAPVRALLNADSSWDVCVGSSEDCSTPVQARPAGDGSSNSVTVTMADGDIFVFDGLGRMISPVPGGGTFTSIDVDSSVLPASESRNLRITVDVGGNVRMCDPNADTAATPPDVRACPD